VTSKKELKQKKERERKVCEAFDVEARKKRKEDKLREMQAKHKADELEKKRLTREE